MVISVVGSVTLSLLTDRLADTPWLTGKLLIFAAVVFFSIMMRLRLAPFRQGIEQLDAEGPSDQLNALLSSSMGRARPFMFASWVALAMAAGLGMVQPGSPQEPAAAAMSEAAEPKSGA